MDPSSDSTHLPIPLLDEAEVRSDPELDPSVRAQTSRPDMCRSGLDIQKTKSTGKGTRETAVTPITESSAHTTSSHKEGEPNHSPLRLALARRLVKRQIFTYMDQGDRKTDIESRTGLSHQCIKWHRRLWRDECSHPRPQSRSLSKSSMRRPRSPDTRSERRLRTRPAYDEKGGSSVAGESNSGKQRRKHRAMKQSKERCLRKGAEMQGSGEGECAERETRGTGFFAGKENIPERDEAMAMLGELKILPFRDLKS